MCIRDRFETGNSKVEEEKLTLAKTLYDKYKDKIVLPDDTVVANEISDTAQKKTVDKQAVPSGWYGLDIGEKTISNYSQIIKDAKTIIWNGPLGMFELKSFETGTKRIGEAICEAWSKGAITVAGGGDTVAAIRKFGLQDKFTHISTGGGASLELLAGKVLPGLVALE